MPEQMPPGLPGQVPLPPGGATPRGFAAVVATARRRRRRRTLEVLSGSTALLVVAAALTALPRDDTRDELTVATPPSVASPAPTAESSADPSPGPAAPAPQASPEPQSTADGASSPEPAPEPSPGGGEPQPAPSAQPARSAEPVAGAEVGPPSERTAMRSGETCDGSGPTPAQGWCSYYDGALEGRPGQTVTLATAVCRITGQGPGTLTADSGEHAVFAVGRQGGRPSWSWSTGRRFSSQGTTFTVEPGTCVRWFVSWDLTDDRGDGLPPGDYYLEALPQVTAKATQNGTSAYLDNTETFRILR